MKRQDRFIDAASVIPSMLDEPVITLPESGAFSSFLFFAVLLLLGGTGAMGCLFTGFDIPVNLLAVVLVQTVCVLICTLRFHLPLRGKWVDLCAWAVWGMVLWSFFSDAAEGFQRLFNLISQTYAEQLRITLPLFEGLKEISTARQTDFYTRFFVVLQFPVIWLLSFALVRLKSGLLSFAVSGFFLLAPMLFSLVPDGWALTMLTLFWLALLAAVPSMHRQRSLAREGVHTADTDLARFSTLCLVGVLGLYMLLFFLICPRKTYQRPEIAQRIYGSFADGLNLPFFFQDGSGNRSQQVDLSHQDRRSFNGTIVLQVRRKWVEEPPEEDADLLFGQKEYLKGFVGSRYTGVSWELLDWEAAQAADKLLNQQAAQTFSSQLAQRMASASYSRLPSYTLSVESRKVSAGSVFAPYGLSCQEPLPDGVGYLDDSGFRSTKLFGTKSYAFTVDPIAGFGTMPLSYPERLLAMRTPHGESFMDELLNCDDYSAGAAAEITSDLWAAPTDLKKLLSGRQLALSQAIEGYSGFVYQEYLQVPKGLRAYLTEYLEENNVELPPSAEVPGESEGRLEYIFAVRELLQNNNRYSLSPPGLPKKTDFVKHFLSESRTGYCVHFASAAVMMFRLAGIPARYAEGYAVPLSDAWVSVPDYNFHAWPEVWISGMGWIPIEVTPAGPDSPASYDNAMAPSAGDISEEDPALRDRPHTTRPINTAVPSLSIPVSTPSPQAEPEAEAQPVSLSPWVPAAIAVGTLLLLIVFVKLQRLLRLLLRRRRFHQKDRSKATLAVYAYILKLHRECSKVVIHVSADPPPEMEAIALKARFSTHDPTEEEIAMLLDYAREVQHKIELHFHPLHLLLCRYALCLL